MKWLKDRFKKLFNLIGPGFITGASDDDPSGITTYAQAGASLGYTPLWTALFTFPLMSAVQLICARIGLVSRMGLARILRKHYPRYILLPVVGSLVIANTINAGTDIGAIASVLNLILPIPASAMIVPIALLILLVEIYGSYRLIIGTFKWLTLALLAYIGAALFAHPNALAMLRGTLIPTLRMDGHFWSMLVAILGTTISPYLFFWQADHEAEEIKRHPWVNHSNKEGTVDAALRFATWDVNIGMFFSNLVMYFIILAAAATLFKVGKTDIQTAADAALALRPLAGNLSSLLLVIGLVGAGFLAIPILTGSAAYAVAEAMGWRYGLDEKPRQARLFYGAIAASTLVGMLINFIGINPMSALLWTAVINGFLTPPLLVIIMLIANNREVMDDQVNGFWLNFLGWLTALVMFGAAIGMLLTWGK